MLHKSDYVTDGIPLVNPANIVKGKIVPLDKMMVSTGTINRLKPYVLHTGMIGWLCGTGSFFMEPNSQLYVDFISTLFASPFAKTFLGGESIGTTMSNLNHTIISKMPVPLPPLAEQKRIVAKLEEILPLCERLK